MHVCVCAYVCMYVCRQVGRYVGKYVTCANLNDISSKITKFGGLILCPQPL